MPTFTVTRVSLLHEYTDIEAATADAAKAIALTDEGLVWDAEAAEDSDIIDVDQCDSEPSGSPTPPPERHESDTPLW